MAAMSAGFGGSSRVTAATNASSDGDSQDRVEPLLEGQRRHGLAAHPLPTRGSREVGRVDLGVVRKCEEPPEAPMERPGDWPPPRRADRAARPCPRRAYRPSERTRAPVRGSCRSRRDRRCRACGPGVWSTRITTFPQNDLLAVGERREREGHVGGLVQAVGRARAGGERPAARIDGRPGCASR